jgi:pyrroloquinoline-quinone synthase
MFQSTKPLDKKTFLQELDSNIAKRAMLTHPFYQAWNEGTLTLDILAEYSKQYYAQVKAFPGYVGAVISQCEDVKVQQLLLDNLREELEGPDNHPELWLRFGESVGAERQEIESADLLPSTVQSVEMLRGLSASSDYRIGIAALYAYESQIPAVAETKRLGLQNLYGINEPRGLDFFSVHETADLGHRQIEKSILGRNCLDTQSQSDVLESASIASEALWVFLDGMHAEYLA